jgi:hypothetical protein
MHVATESCLVLPRSESPKREGRLRIGLSVSWDIKGKACRVRRAFRCTTGALKARNAPYIGHQRQSLG